MGTGSEDPGRRRGKGTAEDGRRQFTVQAPDVAGEFRDPELDEAMQPAQSATEVLHQAMAKADELAQLLGGGVGQARRRRALLRGEAGDPQRVDRIGLGTRQIFAGEARGPQRVVLPPPPLSGGRGGSAPAARIRRAAALRLAVEGALALFPLRLHAALLTTLRDGVDDAEQDAEHHRRDADEGERHGRRHRAIELMNRS
jgi:hypothetical protein